MEVYYLKMMNFTWVYNKINKKMSTFRKPTQNKVITKKEITKPVEQIKEPAPVTADTDHEFALEEARYLLSLIAKTDFSGKDVQVVYNIAVKLQSIIKNNLTEDNGNV